MPLSAEFLPCINNWKIKQAYLKGQLAIFVQISHVASLGWDTHFSLKNHPLFRLVAVAIPEGSCIASAYMQLLR